MKIGCLQFAPKVGDVSNNIARAEAVLSNANQNDLENLDLLVLPEMAFSGKSTPLPSWLVTILIASSRVQLQVARTHCALS